VSRAPLYAVAVLLATLVVQSAGAVVKGDERVLVVLATSGSRPYTVAEVERTAGQAANYFDNASFGKVKLQIDVTPWLAAFTANPGCGGTTNRSLEGVVAPAKVAAGRAGFDLAHYDDVIYAIADSHCGFHGATWGHEVMLTRQPNLQLVVHELGHAFGLGHAQASDCITIGGVCGIDETGDPFSPMGSGDLDFSAYEKVTLGWIRDQPHVTVAKRYVLAPPTRESTLAQSLIVDTEQGSWWIEYRAQPFQGLLFRFIDNRAVPSPFAESSVLMRKLTKAKRPWLAKGESYRIPGSFRVTLMKAAAGRAQVRFR